MRRWASANWKEKLRDLPQISFETTIEKKKSIYLFFKILGKETSYYTEPFQLGG